MKIGDRVRCISREEEDKVRVGEEGIVLSLFQVRENRFVVAVDWEGAGNWWMTDEEIELVN